MDAFYASIEQRDDPSLRGRPVVVGAWSSRGVVAAASYEARRFGVHSAMPSAQARRLCPDAVFLRGDMGKYQRESGRVFRIFQRFTPAVERISLDEAFLDPTGTEALHGPARALGERLRREMRAETGLAVSVGIAPVKMVAKIASDLAKPDGLLEVAPDEVRAFMDPLPVRRIWGIGPVAGERLESLGIETIADLARASEERLREALGSFGPAVARLARGEDARDVEPVREARSYGEENTFGDDVRDRATLERAIRAHAESVARRLRRDRVRGRCVTLKVKLARRLGAGRFPLLTRSLTLPTATDDGGRITRSARSCLDRIDLQEPVRLLGVSVSRIEKAEPDQLSLLPDESSARTERLNSALDQIRDRFGPGALRHGTGHIDRAALSLQIKRGDHEPNESGDVD